ncbi:hypothetical protein [Paraburkholderia lycopersici]|uniref:hypothetical protein n=1 Tax=Paraburkholderia lycopersici TaxID=416944 RepID=UPI0015A48495|nr:hypothetical protein [Paraburkholderia lycopersici]
MSKILVDLSQPRSRASHETETASGAKASRDRRRIALASAAAGDLAGARAA